MQIRNRLFSYPVYTSGVDDYKNNDFKFEYYIDDSDDILKLHYTTKISNQFILNEIEKQNLKLTVLLECARTAFRRLYVLQKIDGTLEIPSQFVSSKVELCCLLLANKDFVVDNKSGINADYSYTKFIIKKGYIVGYDNTYPFIVDKEKDELFKTSSIISVVKKMDLENFMDIDLNNDNKIKIQLGPEMYQYFVQLQGQDKLPVVHSMIVLPALVYVIEQIKNVNYRETYEDYYWYRCIDRQLELLGIAIDSPVFQNKSSLNIAQELLKFPVKKALINLTVAEEVE